MATEPIVKVGRGAADDPPPRPNEPEIWEWLENMAEESQRVRREEARLDQVDQWLDIYYGRHWNENMPSYKPAVVVNELRTLILSEASDLSESDLRIFVQRDPRTGGRDEQAERGIKAVWAREEVNLKMMFAGVWALICGTGFLRYTWDPEAFRGMGDVTVEDLDPRYVLPDPDAIDDRKWAYVILECPVDLMEIRRMFPMEGIRVRPEDRWSSKDRSTVAPDHLTNVSYLGPMAEDSLVGKGLLGYKKARARLFDCLVRDDSTETKLEPRKDPGGFPMKDENGETLFEESRVAKYPKGRRIVAANGVVLFDGPNADPTGDFGILRVVLEPTLGRFWGTGFVQQTMELQLAADKLMSSVVENAIRLNNGIVHASTNTGVDWESFSSIPGQVVLTNQGSTFDIKYPPAMPADMIQAPWRMLDMQRRILGFPESRTGAGGRGNVSAELSETDIAQAQSATRLRSRLLYNVAQRLAEGIFARMAAGYLTERSIPTVQGQEFKPVVWQPIPNPEKYQVYVDPASFQVMSRTMLKRLGMALYRLKAVDRDSLLEAIGWPEWQKVSKRMAQGEMQAMRMKLMAKGGRGGK